MLRRFYQEILQPDFAVGACCFSYPTFLLEALELKKSILLLLEMFGHELLVKAHGLFDSYKLNRISLSK